MYGFLVAATGVLILALMSVVANQRLRDRDRLPMQWSLTGKVNWSAPRHVALAFTPILAALVLSAAALKYSGDPRAVGILAVITTAFVVMHLLHLHLMERRTAN